MSTDNDGQEFYSRRPPLSPAGRAVAVVGWSSFLGAVVATPVYLYAGSMPGIGIGHASVVFLAAWAAAIIPAGMAWLLADRDA